MRLVEQPGTTKSPASLIGVGLYTPVEAGRLIEVAPSKFTRWLRGHQEREKWYEPLWEPEVNLDDSAIYLTFRDLLEVRIAARFIERGLSPQKVRRAINVAREMVGDRPLSTTWLKTDGRSVFLRVARDGSDEPTLIDIFKSQYAFNAMVEPSLRDIDFDGPMPKVWWPRGRKLGVLIDPNKAFGQPVERETSIPAEALANAAIAEGSAEAAARAWRVPIGSVRRAVIFQKQLDNKKAA